MFEHDNRVYQQLQGTAIGTTFAPHYAILFMGNFEETAIEGTTNLKPVFGRVILTTYF